MPVPGDVMGRSLKPTFDGSSLPPDTLAVSELFSVGRELRSFRRPDHKLIHNHKSKESTIYDLAADPGEQAPLRDFNSEMVRGLLAGVEQTRAWLDDFRKRLRSKCSPRCCPKKSATNSKPSATSARRHRMKTTRLEFATVL